MSKPVPPTYHTTNWRAYNAALRQRGSLLVWFDPEIEWLAAPRGRTGRPAAFSDAAIQTCLTLKALFGLALRQAEGLVASLLKMGGLPWPVPDFSTLCRRQKRLTVAIPYSPSRGALHRLVDSTGIKAVGEGEWIARKHGASRPRQWRKVHPGIDVDTMEVRAVEVTGSRVGDAPMLSERHGPGPSRGAHQHRHRGRGLRHASLPRRHRGSPDPRRDPHPAQWTAMAGEVAQRPGSKRYLASVPPPRPVDLEEVGPVPPAKSRRGQDALPQAAGRAPHGSRPRPSDRRAPHPHRHPQSLHPTRCSRDDAHRMTPSEVRGRSPQNRLLQQSHQGAKLFL